MDEGPRPAPTSAHAAEIHGTEALTRRRRPAQTSPARIRIAPEAGRPAEAEAHDQARGERRRDRPEEDERRDDRSGGARRASARALDEERDERVHAEDRGPEQDPAEIRRRRRHPRERGEEESGDARRRRWSRAKSASEAAARTIRPRRSARLAFAPAGRCSTANSSAVTPTARLAAPARSRGSRRRSRDSIICVATRTNATMPSGMLMREDRAPAEGHRHPRAEERPDQARVPQTLEKRPWTLARSSSE